MNNISTYNQLHHCPLTTQSKQIWTLWFKEACLSTAILHVFTTPYNFVTPSHKQNKVQYSYFQVHRGIYMYLQSASSLHSDKAREDMTFRGSNNPRNVGTSITKCFKPYQHHPHTLTKVREEITTFRGSNNPRNIGNLKYKIF